MKYIKPTVKLINASGIGISELAARTCYSSFENSENESIREFDINANDLRFNENLLNIKVIKSSKLLDDLSWTYFHHSILEHINLSFYISGIGRGVLQEQARHRIQSISVKSTRYTLTGVINAFVNSIEKDEYSLFLNEMKRLDLFIIEGDYLNIEISGIYNKLLYQYNKNPLLFLDNTLSKEQKEIIKTNPDNLLELLNNAKKKRNAGDTIKHIIGDNWKTDLVVTLNLRALKNYFSLRDSGAAWFQIRDLAKEMKKVIPYYYLDLIIKSKD